VDSHGVDYREFSLLSPLTRCKGGLVNELGQVGAILQTTAYSVPHIMIARFITGIGTGIETSTVPMYQSELCEAEKRGRLVSSEPLFVGVGIVIAYWFDYGMSFTAGPIAWRLPIACQIVFAVVSTLYLVGCLDG
jgi:MFS family permease